MFKEALGLQKRRDHDENVANNYRVNPTINAENVIERVQTFVPNPVIGDMYYENVYSDIMGTH